MASIKSKKRQLVGSRIVTREIYDGPTGRVQKAFDDALAKQIADPYTEHYGGLRGDFQVIQPTYPPSELMKLPLQNNTLGQCIEAMATNIECFGYTLEYIGPEDQKESEESQAEKMRIDELLAQPNDEDTFQDHRKKCRNDYESVGWTAMEVSRKPEDQSVNWFAHLPAHTLRKTRKDEKWTTYSVWLKRGGEYVEVKKQKQFRRYVQLVGGKRVYFKEFGDPRLIDPATGLEDKSIKPRNAASELIWIERYVPGEAYGLPRWTPQIPSILGSRESEMTNLQFFKDNAIPAMAIMVSGGTLTDETIADIETAFSAKGLESMNRVLILEAKADEDSGGIDQASPAPSLDIRPLTAERQQDAMFQEYDKNNMAKVRSSFRLPPIFLGFSDDYTRATAESSLATAECQVFGPERITIDKIYNDKILSVNGQPPKFWKFRSNPAKIVGSETVMDSLERLNNVGAMTPNIAIRIMNEVFGLSVPLIEDDWGDEPFIREGIKLALSQDPQIKPTTKKKPKAAPPKAAPAPAPRPRPGPVQGRMPTPRPVKKYETFRGTGGRGVRLVAKERTR